MTLPLSIRGLEKSFGRFEAVRGLSLEVRPGEVYGLLGPNGSGKSTTLRCALGLLSPDEGELEVLGEPAHRIHRLRGRVGVAFDEADLVPGLSARENLEYARRLSGTGSGIEDLLERVGLAPHRHKRARALSLGQKRRLSIARALLGSPELVVLDEPLSGLDTLGVRDMLRLFGELRAGGVTVVLSSHRLHEMETVCDRVAIVHSGRVLREAALEELCGRGDRIAVTAAPEERARELFADRVRAAHPGPDACEFHVECAPGDAARLNRELVEGGCDVFALEPRRRTLLSAFEEELARAAEESR